MFSECDKEESGGCERSVFVRYVYQFCEGVAEAWAGSQCPFDVVCVFSGVVENLTDLTEKSSTYDEPSTHLFRFVEVASIMFVWNPALRGSKHRCASRWVLEGVGYVSMQKRLHKGGATRFRDSTLVTGSFGNPFSRACAVVHKAFHNSLGIACSL